MRAPGSEDVVVIEKKAGEARIITVNCPDRTGLGCDVCRIILDFGLSITKGGKILPEMASASSEMIPLNPFSFVISVNSFRILLSYL